MKSLIVVSVPDQSKALRLIFPMALALPKSIFHQWPNVGFTGVATLVYQAAAALSSAFQGNELAE
ncbi:hypothetical protein D3C85_600540 [compost metagenome]